MTLTLSNPSGPFLNDGTATGSEQQPLLPGLDRTYAQETS